MKFEDAVLEIKNRVDLVRVIGQYVSLKKAGNSWMGCCPFHSEKTPSFHVRPDKGYFKCFGCDAAGDVFTFLEKQTGQLFKDIVIQLAQETGVQIEMSSGVDEEKKHKHKAELLKCLMVAHQYFKNALASQKNQAGSPLAYLIEERKLAAKAIGLLQLGFGGASDQELLTFFKKKQIPLEHALEIGLLNQGSHGIYSFFARRITIPIFNHRGQLVGFGGRSFGDFASNSPKYVNSKASFVYDKGAVLYGLFESLPLLKEKNPIVIVEGYFDVIAIRDVGFAAVAPCGTSLTDGHIQLLKRYSQEVILCLDQDESGKKAHQKLLKMLLQSGFQVQTALMTEKDPDALWRAGQKQRLREILLSAPNAVEVLIRQAQIKGSMGVTQRISAVTELLPFLSASSSLLINRQYIRLASQILNEDEAVLLKEASKINPALNSLKTSKMHLPRQEKSPSGLSVQQQVPLFAWSEAEKLFLRAVLAHPEIVLDYKGFESTDFNPELFNFLCGLQKKHVENPTLLPHEVLQSISVMPGTNLVGILFESVKNKQRITKEEAQKIFEGTLRRNEQKKQRQLIQKNQEAINLAQLKGDFTLVKQLLMQQTETLKKHSPLPPVSKQEKAEVVVEKSPELTVFHDKKALKPQFLVLEEDLKDDEGWT